MVGIRIIQGRSRNVVEDGRAIGWPEPLGFSLQDLNVIQHLWNHARTARLSELYYGQRLGRFSAVDCWIGLLVAIFSSGSGIAGWALWNGAIGATVWAIIAGIAAILGVARPLLNLDRKIETATRQQALYRKLLSDLESLVFDIEQSGYLSAEQYRRYLRALDTLRQGTDADDPHYSVRRLRKLQERVRREMPADELWVPTIRPEAAPATT